MDIMSNDTPANPRSNRNKPIIATIIPTHKAIVPNVLKTPVVFRSSR